MSNHSGKRKKGKNVLNTIRRRELLEQQARERQSAPTPVTRITQTPKKPARRKLLSAKVLYSNRAIAIYSLIISIGLWVFVTLNMSNSSAKTIYDVPIRVDTTAIEETFGLQMISIVDPPALNKEQVDVILTGSIYQLSQVTPDDVSVTAQVSGVNRAGESTLSLSASCTVRDVTVKIAGNYDFVKVWFDHIREKDVKVDKAVASGVTAAAEDLIIGDAVSSIKTMRISGPETVIDTISSVQVRAEANKELSEPLEFPGVICYLDADGNELSSDKTSFLTILDFNDTEETTGTAAGAPAEEEITVIVPVSKKAELPLALNFTNCPEGFDTKSLSYKITPATINVEGDIEAIDRLVEAGVYMVDGIDLSVFTPSSSRVKLKLNLSTGITELGGVSEVDCVFNMSGYSTKTITLENNGKFALSGNGSLKADITTESLDIVVCGPISAINSIGSDSCSVTVDMSGHDGSAGQRKMVATVTLKNKSKCWVTGSYTVMVLVS